jgi:NAD dependent epimerase/dehydratase family enzyme
MKIVIPGGTGQVGTMLARAFVADGHEVVVLGRSPGKQEWRIAKWDGKTLGDWTGEIDGADVVINLAGRNVNCRYNDENRREMMDSRIDSTRVVGNREIGEPAQSLASGKHRDDLLAPIRRPERRDNRDHRRQRA